MFFHKSTCEQNVREKKQTTNLKLGVGYPCAGQVRHSIVSFSLETINPLVFTLNLGNDPPMGS